MGDYYYDDDGRGPPPPRRRRRPPPLPLTEPKRGFNWAGLLIGGAIAAAAAVVIVGFIRRKKATDGDETTAPVTSGPVTSPLGPGPAYPPPPIITENPDVSPMIDPGEIEGPIIQTPPPVVQTPPPVVQTPPPADPTAPLDPILPDQTYNWIPMRHDQVKIMNPYGAYWQFGRVVFERPDILQELGPVVTNGTIDVVWSSKLQFQVIISVKIPNDIGMLVEPLDGATVFFPLGGLDNRLISALGSATLLSTTYETDAVDDYEIYRTLKWAPAFVYAPNIDTLNALLPRPKGEAVIFNTNLYLKMNVKNASGIGRATAIKSGTATMVYKLK